MVGDLEDALNWRPDPDMYGVHQTKDSDPADFWKPPGYTVVDYKDKQDLEEQIKREEQNKKYKKMCLKAMIVSGTGALISFAALLYITVPDIVKYGFQWPF